MRLLRILVITFAGGLLVAAVLFRVTAPWPGMLTTPIGDALMEANVVWEYPGSDLWTGEYRPLTKTYTDIPTGQRATKEYRDDKMNHRAIPVPVGFVAGSLLTLGASAIFRRRKTAQTPAPRLVGS